MLFQIVTMSLVPIYGFVQYEEFKILILYPYIVASIICYLYPV